MFVVDDFKIDFEHYRFDDKQSKLYDGRTDCIIVNEECTYPDSDWVGTGLPTSEVPVPAAVWLFGSGLLGLAGVARRRKSA